MEFGVRFEAPGGYSISIDSTEIGTRGVSKIRRECGIENLELDVIRGRKESFYRNIDMVVPEVLAFKCKHFENVNHIKVTIPDGGLNEYTKIETVVEKDQKTGRISNARLQHVIEKEKILNDWIAAGYPLEWDPA